MEKKERIRQIRKVLDKHHRVTFNKLKEIVVEKKGLMATQTFSDAGIIILKMQKKRMTIIRN